MAPKIWFVLPHHHTSSEQQHSSNVTRRHRNQKKGKNVHELPYWTITKYTPTVSWFPPPQPPFRSGAPHRCRSRERQFMNETNAWYDGCLNELAGWTLLSLPNHEQSTADKPNVKAVNNHRSKIIEYKTSTYKLRKRAGEPTRPDLTDSCNAHLKPKNTTNLNDQNTNFARVLPCFKPLRWITTKWLAGKTHWWVQIFAIYSVH